MKNLLWNMFASIHNGQLSKKSFIIHSQTKICESFLKILWSEGFILGYTIIKKQKQIKIFLKYVDHNPAIKKLRTLSKPGRRFYYNTKQLWKINSSNNFVILSTNQGLKSIFDCKKLNIGGEPILIIN